MRDSTVGEGVAAGAVDPEDGHYVARGGLIDVLHLVTVHAHKARDAHLRGTTARAVCGSDRGKSVSDDESGLVTNLLPVAHVDNIIALLDVPRVHAEVGQLAIPVGVSDE